MRIDYRIAVRIEHDDPLLAAGLRAVLSADPEIVAIDGVDGHALRLHAAVGNAGVIVADYEHGLEHAMSARGSALPNDVTEARVMVLTTRDSELDIRRALQAGVHGYLVQGCGRDEVVYAVKSIARGVKYFSPRVSQRMAETLAHAALTERQIDVLRLLCDGLSNKLIARNLGLATGTVKAHLRAILAKLGASSRTQAVMLAAQRGLVKGSAVQPLVLESAASGARAQVRRAPPGVALMAT